MKLLRTDRLTLEPQVAAHADEMFEVLSDPAIYEYENEPPPSAGWLRDRFDRLESRGSADGSETWLNWVMRAQNGRLIGYVQATVHADARADVAYILASAHWGLGLASEAVRAMLDELKARYAVTRFDAALKRGNRRSMRLLERLGFSPASAESLATHPVEPDEFGMSRAA